MRVGLNMSCSLMIDRIEGNLNHTSKPDYFGPAEVGALMRISCTSLVSQIIFEEAEDSSDISHIIKIT